MLLLYRHGVVVIINANTDRLSQQTKSGQPAAQTEAGLWTQIIRITEKEQAGLKWPCLFFVSFLITSQAPVRITLR
jgi:hypothetical protein